jgi:hypothetical protein
MKTIFKNPLLLPVLIARTRFVQQSRKGAYVMRSRCRDLFLVSLATAWSAGSPVPTFAQVPVDVIGTLPLAEYNTWIAPPTDYHDWGFEPFIAVNPADPNKIVISSSAYNTAFVDGASLWYSTNGGKTWGIRFPIKNPPSGKLPSDQVYAYDSAGVLHGVLLAQTNTAIYHGSTADPDKDGVNGRPATVWNWTLTAINSGFSTTPDQPWLAVRGGIVFVGYGNSVSDGSAFEERVAKSFDNGTSFTVDNPIGTPGRLSVKYRIAPDQYFNPGTRIAVDGNGNLYAIFGFATNNINGIPFMQYRLNRSSAGGAWDYTSNNLPIGGLPIDSGTSSQGTDPALWLGAVNELLGNTTAIATDKNGAHIYAVYGKQVDGVDRLLLAEFHDDGTGNLVERANPVAFSMAGQQAALPSVAVTDDGTVYILYDTFTLADAQFHVHLTRSSDQGMTFSSSPDKVLEDFSAPFVGQKILGDYQYLIALSNTVYGTFAGRGLAAAENPNGFDRSSNIDPFFFSFTPTSPPQLTIAASGTNVVLSWPTNAVEFTLQSTTNLFSAATWVTNSPEPVVVNGQNTVTNPIAGAHHFYRLIQ